jgi:hypothetical protein
VSTIEVSADRRSDAGEVSEALDVERFELSGRRAFAPHINMSVTRARLFSR